MRELYYSDVLHKQFNDKESCIAAEKEYEEKHAAELKAKEERTKEAKEVEEAYRTYLNLRNEFVKKYGSYHMTITDTIPELPLASIFDLFSF